MSRARLGSTLRSLLDPVSPPAGGRVRFWDAAPANRVYLVVGSVFSVASTTSDVMIELGRGGGDTRADIASMVLACLAFLAQWWRTTVAYAVVLLLMAASLVGGDAVSVVLVLPFVLGTVVATAQSGRYLLAAGATALAWVVAVSLVGSGKVDGVAWLTLLLVVVGLGVGASIRAAKLQRVQDGRRIAEAERLAREAAERERRILARDLHDIVAHNLTIIAMQANAAQYLGTPEAAQQVVRVVGESARDALTDLRRMLSILQEDGVVEPAPTPGTPETDDAATVAQLGPGAERLAEELRLAGVDAAVRVELGEVGLNLGVRAALYRVMQESVTNVAKHAGPGQACEISIEARGGEVVLEVVNTLPEDGPRSVVGNSSRVGLTSMRDRIEAFGGRLEVGPCGGDRWRVRAAVPRPEA